MGTGSVFLRLKAQSWLFVGIYHTPKNPNSGNKNLGHFESGVGKGLGLEIGGPTGLGLKVRGLRFVTQPEISPIF